MFATFHSSPSHTAGRQDGNSKTAPAKRPKRAQVRLACDWCKLMRIKCDNHRPCSNCQQASRDCSTSRENQFRSIADAVSEVKRLRARIRDIETTQPQQQPQQQQQSAIQEDHAQNSPPEPGHSSPNVLPSPARTSVSEPGGAKDGGQPTQAEASGRQSSVSDQRRHTASPLSRPQVAPILQGVTSLPSLLARLDEFLQSNRPQLQLELDLSSCAGNCSQQHINATHGYGFLTRAQESHYLDLFWQTHYFSFPILNEGQFRSDFKALWADQDAAAPRKPSPLVDIMLALCIQLGSSFRRQNAGESGNGAPLAGYQYYRRCQEAIDQTIESPSITTVQCYIFSIVYLYEAGLLNRAQAVAGKAVMMAMLIRLPNEPRSTEPEPQKEVARRTWWSLYILDGMLSMEVGRPPLLGPYHSTCDLPSDSIEVAKWLGPHYSFDDSCPTWLGFQTQTLRLINAVRQVRSAVYTKYESIVGERGYSSFVDNTAAREECAGILTAQMKQLDAWAAQVSEGYTVPRRDGQPFSTDRSAIDIRPDTIVHCQRQRLLLELQYHQHCMSLYQPFITLSPAPDVSTPLSDTKAVAALNHAMALTAIMHQSLTSSETLGGTHHVLRWQQNALFIMLGFAYTYPLSSSIPAAARAIEMATAVIDMYCEALPQTRGVAAVARALADDAGAVNAGLHSGNVCTVGSTVGGGGGGGGSISRGSSVGFQASMLGPSTAVTPTQMHQPGPPNLPLATTSTIEGPEKAAPTTFTNLPGTDFVSNIPEGDVQLEAVDMDWGNMNAYNALDYPWAFAVDSSDVRMW
ncbi:hypothetical protein KVR01_013788 [Diaporthe batatas]|uniref:uncharacterized protein n=1 Tax=Diaporthe batatas TaxID=748121 RepID=UPI001D0401DC|nr:uncharacterized protein KVR01_013788 [Diaporthe batatas]KAG8156336.1 hypothetical protein KVR01_013788 [Diaporthe batatas]